MKYELIGRKCSSPFQKKIGGFFSSLHVCCVAFSDVAPEWANVSECDVGFFFNGLVEGSRARTINSGRKYMHVSLMMSFPVSFQVREKVKGGARGR